LVLYVVSIVFFVRWRREGDYLLPEDLLNASFASANLDTTGVQGSLINTLRLLECELTLAPAR
jgi:hypothetical protein